MEKLVESHWYFETCTMGCKSSRSQILYPRLLIAYDRTGPDSNLQPQSASARQLPRRSSRSASATHGGRHVPPPPDEAASNGSTAGAELAHTTSKVQRPLVALRVKCEASGQVECTISENQEFESAALFTMHPDRTPSGSQSLILGTPLRAEMHQKISETLKLPYPAHKEYQDTKRTSFVSSIAPIVEANTHLSWHCLERPSFPVIAFKCFQHIIGPHGLFS